MSNFTNSQIRVAIARLNAKNGSLPFCDAIVMAIRAAGTRRLSRSDFMAIIPEMSDNTLSPYLSSPQAAYGRLGGRKDGNSHAKIKLSALIGILNSRGVTCVMPATQRAGDTFDDLSDDLMSIMGEMEAEMEAEAATDEAATDEAATDEAATDEAATDEAATDIDSIDVV